MPGPEIPQMGRKSGKMTNARAANGKFLGLKRFFIFAGWGLLASLFVGQPKGGVCELGGGFGLMSSPGCIPLEQIVHSLACLPRGWGWGARPDSSRSALYFCRGASPGADIHCGRAR